MKHSKFALTALALSVAAIVVLPGTASALLNNLFNKNQQPQQQQVQQYYIHDEESFTAVAKSFHRMPFNDPALEFDITLPKDWTSEQTLQSSTTSDLNRKIIGDVARFKSPYIGTMQAIVTIQAIRLDHEISAENWLKNYVLVNGCAADGKMTALSEKKAAVNCISNIDGKSSYIYVSVQMNTDNAVVARFESPLMLKDMLDFLRRRTIDSFRFILATEKPIEEQKGYSFTDALKFSYPASWVINAQDTANTSNMSMQLYNQPKPDQINGMIRFVLVRRTGENSLKKEIENIKTYFDSFLGMDFKKLISSDKAKVSDRFIFSRYEVYQIQSKKENSTPQELRMAVLGDNNWYIFVFLLTPSDTENFYTWACNTQAFDMILARLK